MAVIVPSIFADAVNEKLRVNLKLGKVALDATDMVDEIKTEGDTVHFPVINRIKDATELSDGVEVTPERVNMTDNTAKIKEIGNAVRVLDKENIQVKGQLMDKLVEQLSESMAKKLDAELVDAIDKEAVFKVATAEASAVTVQELDNAMLKFGDQVDSDKYACILVNSRLIPSLRAMDAFTSASKTYTNDGNGIIVNGVAGTLYNIPILVSDNNTYDTDKNECKSYIIQKDAIGYVTQKGVSVEEERNAKLRATDIVTTTLVASKLLDSKGVVVLRKTIS